MPQLSAGHVFMSYSRRDDAVMRRVVTFLRNQGIKVWVDNERLIPGTPIWEEEIEKAIKNAPAIIVVLSPDSKNSEWVRREISLADQYRRRVFPVLVRGDEETSITLRLTNRQYVDIRKDEDAGLNSMSASLLLYLEELDTQEQKAKQETDRLAAHKAKEDADRLAMQKVEEERIAREKADAQRKAKKEEGDRLAAQQMGKQKVEQEKIEREAVQPKRVSRNIIPIYAALGGFGILLIIGLFVVVAFIAANLKSPATPAPIEAPAVTTTASFRVAVVMPSAINDMASSQSMYDALMRVQEEMGGPDKFEVIYSENMFVVDDAAAAIRDYAAQGYNLVIAHGSQYGSSLQEIAPDFPDTSFAWGMTTNTFNQPNIFAYEAASQEGGYVNGVLAAALSKTKIIGIVAPIETGDTKLYVEGFKQGVAATDSAIKVNVNYIGSFTNVAVAAEAASIHISNGADILTGTAPMVVGAIGKAKDSNVLWFASDANQSSLAPSIVVDSQVYHWEVILKEMISLIQSGALGGQSFAINLKNGGEVIEYNPDYKLSPEAKALGDKAIQGIIDGTITITIK